MMAGGGVTLNLRLDKIKKNKIKIKGTKEMSARLLARALPIDPHSTPPGTDESGFSNFGY